MSNSNGVIRRPQMTPWLPLLAALLGCATPSGLRAEDAPQLGSLISGYGLSAESVGVEVRGLEPAAAPLLSWRANTPLNPASAIKVLTTAAALEAFGPSYRYQTVVYLEGALQNGVLNGNLVIQGQGDPSLVSEGLWRLVVDLRNRGIREIRGDLVGDDSYLESTGWRADFSRSMSSNSANGALSLNYNHLQIWVDGDAAGGAPRVRVDPELGDYVTLRNQARSVAGSANTLMADLEPRTDGGLILTVRGSIGTALAPVQFYRSVPEPTLYYLAALREMLRSTGGVVRGKLRRGMVPTGAREFYRKQSEDFLSQTLILLNKYSNNFIAEQLVMSLGAQQQPGGGSHARGLEKLRTYMQNCGVDTRGAAINAGSGLSRTSRISAAQLNGVLACAARDPRIAPEMSASLSIFGEDGTTKKRPDRQRLGALVRAKTGSLDNVVTLSGYIFPENPAGESAPLVFTILINAPGADINKLRPLQNAILELAMQQLKRS